MKKFLREYRIEIIALLVALSGLFLLVEKLEIRVTVRRLFYESLTAIRSAGEQLIAWAVDYITHFSISDLIGFILVALALAFIIWRIRYRFINSPRWLAVSCPRCQGSVQRTHRNLLDRWLGMTLLPHSRRYRCANPECGWSGLRHYEHRSRHSENAGLDQEAIVS